MKGLILLAGFLVLSKCEKPFDYAGYKVLNCPVKTEDQGNLLRRLQDEKKVDLWNPPTLRVGYTMVQISPGMLNEVENLLLNEDIICKTAFSDLQKAIEEEKRQNKPLPAEYKNKRKVSDFNYSRYHNYNEVQSFLREVSGEYAHLAEHINIGTTYENRPIVGLRISTAPKGTRPAVFIECGIHAREWVSTSTALYIIRELTLGYKNDSVIQKLVNSYEWYIIPSTNPDGYVYTFTTNRNWRKTRSRSANDPRCYGADPNRNWDSYFCGAGSSRIPCSDTYCGDYAFSEKETRALRNITTQIGSRLKAYFAIHSFSQLWMYPYGYTYSLPSNQLQLQQISQKAVAALQLLYGTRYKIGPIAATIYQASGSSIDWVYDNIGTKIAFALELRDTGTYGFLLPANQIVPTAMETWAGMKAAVLALP